MAGAVQLIGRDPTRNARSRSADPVATAADDERAARPVPIERSRCGPILAYRQPIPRVGIELIGGSASDGALTPCCSAA